MPAFTSFLNLYKPGGGSSGLILPDEVVDIDRINANSDLIDAYAAGWGQASARNHQFYGPVSGMAGITGMKRGDTYKESDGTFKLWEYDGSAWVVRDTGWTLCTAFDANWKVSSNFSYRALSVRRVGKQVSISGTIRRLTGTIEHGYIGAVVPVGFRPAVRELIGSALPNIPEVSVETNGNIDFWSGSDVSGAYALFGSWLLD
jgi:hypothetical protein